MSVIKEGYYSDGITRYTDPLWTVKCNDCKAIYWSVIYHSICSKCKSQNIISTNKVIEERRKSDTKRNI